LIIVEGLVYDLRCEIVKRELLEQDLRRSQETLLTRLRLHSARLSILFDQVLVREGYSNLDELMLASLAKISSLLNCHSTLYYHFEEENTLVLEASHGGRPGSYNVTFPTPAALLPPTEEVYPYPASRSQGGQTPWRLDGMEESLAKWVFAQDNVLGLLVVNWEEGCLPAVEEIALFGALADTLGLLVENARLRHEIEETAAVLERRRLARDLHDSVTQSLLTLLMYTRKALDETTNPELVTGTLSKMETGARQALKEARLMFFELRRDVFAEGGMLEQITSRLDSVERRAGINAELAVEPGAFWPMEWEYQLFFIVIEALNNSLKHARASAVVVRLKNAGEDFVLEVEDNGRGFHTSSQPAGGMGMTNMAERAEIIGAVFEAGPGSSGGALIRVSGKAGRGEPDTDRGSEVQDG
jgi:signal transduction histidine kinase